MMLQLVLVVAIAIIANAVALPLEQQGHSTGAVPVELFVMSQCPDAISCESAFAEVCKFYLRHSASIARTYSYG
jgi:hypothetical protein